MVLCRNSDTLPDASKIDNRLCGATAKATMDGTCVSDYLRRSGKNWVVGSDEMAIARRTGTAFQGIAALALGKDAGKTGRGANSVAIGKLAGETNQFAGSIVLGVRYSPDAAKANGASLCTDE